MTFPMFVEVYLGNRFEEFKSGGSRQKAKKLKQHLGARRAKEARLKKRLRDG